MDRSWKIARWFIRAGMFLLAAGALASCASVIPPERDPNSRSRRARAAPTQPGPGQAPAGAMAVDVRQYPWKTGFEPANALANRIPPPEGFVRAQAERGSFGHWLRGLPLKPGRPPVLCHDGRPKANQEAHHAVVDIDVGTKNLQQCADAVMRLRGEYLFAAGRGQQVSFRTSAGDWIEWRRWAGGYRPKVQGNRLTWSQTARADSSHANLRKYMDVVFAYCGTASLVRQLQSAAQPADMRIGDVFIRGGSPGHAVIVLDLAENAAAGKKVFLLAQSYMPAQDVHVLRNPNSDALSPWYDLAFGDTLRTPEWTFASNALMRFP